MSDVGRPTELDNELRLKIRELILEGKTMKEIAEVLGLAYKTMEGWMTRNYEGFADSMHTYRLEWQLQKAQENINEALIMDDKEPVLRMGNEPARDNDGKIITVRNPKLTKIKIDTSLFVAETVGKETYSKRSELTGKNGKDLQFKWVDDDDDNDNDTVQTKEVGEGIPPEQEAVDGAGASPESGEDNGDTEPPTAWCYTSAGESICFYSANVQTG